MYGMYYAYPAIVMEQNPPGDPGNVGDSYAETYRAALLAPPPYDLKTSSDTYNYFRTTDGYLRHPACPWREDDMSGDNLLPGYIYAYLANYGIGEMYRRIKEAGWKTGNGRYISLQFVSAIVRAKGKSNWFSDLPVLFQAIALRVFGFLWKDSTADCLNHFQVLLFASRTGHTRSTQLALKITPPLWLMDQIVKYYIPEPNSEWLLERYSDAASRL